MLLLTKEHEEALDVLSTTVSKTMKIKRLLQIELEKTTNSKTAESIEKAIVELENEDE